MPALRQTLTMNLRSDDHFAEDEGWHRAAERYETFLRTRSGQKILFLELGVGYNTPSIIKVPFWQFTVQNPRALYVCINQDEAFCPESIQSRSLCIGLDVGEGADGASGKVTEHSANLRRKTRRPAPLKW